MPQTARQTGQMAFEHSVAHVAHVGRPGTLIREGELCGNAEVFNAQPPGIPRVADHRGGTIGFFLPAAEHGLNTLWMPEKKGKGGGGKTAKICLADGCSNKVYARGLCGAHGRKPCSIEGCTSQAHTRGLCTKHGARGTCVEMGCVTNAQKRGGYCSKHSKTVACAAPNCSTSEKKSTAKVCPVDGCSNTVHARGLCTTHGRKPCSVEGCTTKAHTRGLCCKHGARCTCVKMGHATNAQKRGGHCSMHSQKVACAPPNCSTPEKKRNATVCLVDGCPNNISARGLCWAHFRKPCSIEGCTSQAIARGFCGKHGANGKCVKMGCVTNARGGGGHCSKHSKKVTCAAPNCSTPERIGKGVCVKHGAYGICTAWGCKTNAYSGKKGLCLTHSKDKPTCSTSGCSNVVVARGLCDKHGARGFCSTAGCGSGAVKDGLCKKHGANGFCTFDDCTTAAHSRGLCSRHGGGSSKVCDIEGCETLAKARGRCRKHGAFGWCKVDGCATPAAQGFEHCTAHGGGKKKKPCSVAGCIALSRVRGVCCKHGGGKHGGGREEEEAADAGK